MEPQMPWDREEASPRVPGEQADRRGVGHGTSRGKRRIPLAVVLPRPARGAGTLIPSAQRFVWVHWQSNAQSSPSQASGIRES